MARWKTPDDAIREATAQSPLRCRGINPAAEFSGGGGFGLAELVHEHTTVLAIVGSFTREEQILLIYYAHRFSYAEIAKALTMRKATAIARHRAAREELARRLIDREVLESDGPAKRSAA
jgi:hypothetical protein